MLGCRDFFVGQLVSDSCHACGHTLSVHKKTDEYDVFLCSICELGEQLREQVSREIREQLTGIPPAGGAS